MTEPDDRAHGALPGGTPDDDALDGAVQADDGTESELDDEGTAEEAGFAEPERAAGTGAAGGALAPTAKRGGREAATSRGERRGPRGGREPATPARVQTASDIAVHVDDRASAIFVIGVIAVFVLIFMNALVLGKGGFLTPIPTPKPVASLAPAASAAPSAAVSPAASAPASAAPSTSPSPSAAASATLKPSASPKPSATPAPKPSATPAPKPSATPRPSASPVPSPSA